MATKKVTKKETTAKKVPEKVTKYKGSQLLRMDKYNNRIARIVLQAEALYSFSEADELIADYLKKKG